MNVFLLFLVPECLLLEYPELNGLYYFIYFFTKVLKTFTKSFALKFNKKNTYVLLGRKLRDTDLLQGGRNGFRSWKVIYTWFFAGSTKAETSD